MPTWLIWVIVIVVVLVVIGAVASMMSKRRTEQHRARADELRAEASAKAGGLTESQRQAEDARAKAELAKTEAQRSEERAAQAEQGHQVEQAGYEDKLREADRLDPEVDTKSADYEPSVWNDESGTPDSTTATSHRAEPESTTTETTTETPAEGTSTRPADGTTTRPTE